MVTIPLWLLPAIVALVAAASLLPWLLLRRRDRGPRLKSTFTDSAGRRWQMRIDSTILRDVKKYCGVDLLELVGLSIERPFGELLGKLVADPVLLVDTIYVCLRRQCDARGVTDEDFGRAMAGDALEHAVEALIAGVIEVMPSRRDRRRLRLLVNHAWSMIATRQDQIDQAVDEAMRADAAKQ